MAIGAILGGIAGLASSLINSGWQGAAVNNSIMAQRRQQQNDDRQYRLASAGRTDAFGNRQWFDDLTGEWKTELTPTQNKIIRAGESEQLRSLIEDAERNRDIRKRQFERGRQATEDYNLVRSQYRYGKPKSEDAIRGELQTLLAGVSEQKSRKGLQDQITTALRQGRGDFLPTLIGASDEVIGADLSENLLKARTGAQAESAAREQAHDAQYLPELQQLAQLSDMGGDMPVRFSDLPQQMAGQQGQQTQLMLQALQNMAGNDAKATANTNAAYKNGGVDIRGLASIISSFNPAQSARTRRVNYDANGNNLMGSF